MPSIFLIFSSVRCLLSCNKGGSIEQLLVAAILVGVSGFLFLNLFSPVSKCEINNVIAKNNDNSQVTHGRII